eukprot:Hpha_TRINITY_DN15541_c6_g2::TRINITY_DN15541_c6_g2_i1::g.109135::m.109135
MMVHAADPAAAALASSACAAAACAASLGGAHPVVCALLSGVAAALAASAGCSPERPAAPLPPQLPPERERTAPITDGPRRIPLRVETSLDATEPTPRVSPPQVALPEGRQLEHRQPTMPADDLQNVLKLSEEAVGCGDSSSPSSVLSSRSIRVQTPRGTRRVVGPNTENSPPQHASSRGTPPPSQRNDTMAAARAAEALAERDSVTAAAAIDSIADVQLRAALADAYNRLSYARRSSVPRKHGREARTRRSMVPGDEHMAEIARQMSEVQSIGSDPHQHADVSFSEQAVLRSAIRKSRMHSYSDQSFQAPSGGIPSGGPIPSGGLPPLQRLRTGNSRNVLNVGHADSSGSSEDASPRSGGVHRTKYSPRINSRRPVSPHRIDSSGPQGLTAPAESFRRGGGHRGMSLSSQSPQRRMSNALHLAHVASTTTPFAMTRRWGTFASSTGNRSDEKEKVMSGMGRACDSSSDDAATSVCEDDSRLNLRGMTDDDLLEGGACTTPAPAHAVLTKPPQSPNRESTDAAAPPEPPAAGRWQQEPPMRMDHGQAICKARKLGMNRSPSSSEGEEESVLERVRRDKPAHVEMYRLSLTQMPSWFINELGGTVKKLDLSDNQLTALPEDLTPLKVLEVLNVSTNKLTSLPDSVTQLPCLTHLIVKVNSITALPADLGKGQSLEEANLSWNQLPSFPVDLFRSGTLRNVNLTENPAIITLPTEWDQVAAEKCVVRLDNDPGLTSSAASMKGEGKPKFEFTNVFPDRVRSGLFLGPLRSAQDRVYARLGITHVVTVGRELDVRPPPHVEHLKVEVDDVPDEELVDLLTGAHRMIDAAKAAGGACFVHCFKGQSRSSTVVITYLMMTEKRKFANALAAVRTARPCVRPNEGFVQQMVRFEEALELERESTRHFFSSMTRSHSRDSEGQFHIGCMSREGTRPDKEPTATRFEKDPTRADSPQPTRRGRRQTWATANNDADPPAGSRRTLPSSLMQTAVPTPSPQQGLNQTIITVESLDQISSLQRETSQTIGTVNGSMDRPPPEPLQTPPEQG